MADKRLANDPVLEGTTRRALEAELRESYAEELGAGTMTEADINRIADGLQAKGTVWQPGFFGKIFEAETANKLNKEFKHEAGHVRRAFSNANDFIKALTLGFDLGVGQIQLLPTLYRNPGIWAKAQAKSIGAMFNPKVWRAYAQRNMDPIRELAQFGSSVGHLPEMLSGLERGTIRRIPGLREAAGPFVRQFHTALDVAKIELWKAWREVTPPEQWNRTVQAIEAQLNTARMESAMVPHGRALLERVLLLAPSYYRGAVNLMAAIGERGVSGKIARQTMGSFIAGSTALFVGVGLALQMKWDEIEKRMDPRQPEFMLWEVEVGGKKQNIGFGGIFRSFLRLAGNVTRTSTEEPGNWNSLSSDKNPIVRWYRGHAGPVPRIGWDLFSGRDFLGTPTTLEELPRGIAPVWLQDVLLRQRGKPTTTQTRTVAEFTGMATLPETRAATELRRAARSWLVRQSSPRLQEHLRGMQQHQSEIGTYAELRSSLGDNDLARAGREYQRLRGVGKTPQQMNEALYPTTAEGLPKTLVGLPRADEQKFFRSLTPEQRGLVKEAQRERVELYRRFRLMLREQRRTPTQTK